MRKLLQLKMYSFLSSRWGMTFCVVGLFVTLNAFFQLMQVLVNQEHIAMMGPSEFLVNVGGRSYQHLMCSEPIDIVYTWVNGSDPKHKKAVADYKRAVRDPNMRACNQTETPDKDSCYKDEDTASRFIDNEELRYSIRSVEKFAPWVRNIFLVTNGQVPSWINTEHPRLTVVTHAEIFTNASHLPTFSSPSIEVHLHRIPGLSNKFIYLNDDVMFGRDVYPDDFVTQNAGQKVFLSWAVPNCADGCPPNWVGDGYCDLACNVSSCDFDAHDCDNYTGPARGGSNTNNRWWGSGTNSNTGAGTTDNSLRYKNYCSKGCPDSWIGDKYCDRMCKNLECAFDAGDCGVEDIFGSMYGVQITESTELIELPSGLSSVYFNLTEIVGGATITDGSHDNVELVRTATISQKFKIMTLTFHRNITFQEVMLSITAENTTESGNKTIIEKSFNITLDTIIHPSNETSPDIVNGTSAETPANPAAPAPGAVGLEPAPNPPQDVAQSPASGGGGAISPNNNNNNNNGPADTPPHSPGERPPVPESIVPVEPMNLQTAQSDSASVIGNSGVENTQQQPPAQESAQGPAQQQTQNEPPSQQQEQKQEQKQEQQQEQLTQNEQPQTLNDDTATPNKEIDDETRSELSLQHQPESRQSPEGYDNDQNKEQQSNPLDSADSSQSDADKAHQVAEIISEIQKNEESKTESDKVGNDSAVHTQEEAAQESVKNVHDWIVPGNLGARVEDNDGGIPHVNDVENDPNLEQNLEQNLDQNLDQKFALTNPDTGDSSGALKANNEELPPPANSKIDFQAGVNSEPNKNSLSQKNDRFRFRKSENKKETPNEEEKEQKEQKEQKQQEEPPKEAQQEQEAEQIKITPPESARNEPRLNKRSILSIPIYDNEEKDESASLLNTKKRGFTQVQDQEEAQENHRRWMESMAEQKKADLQQLEASKREMRELEIKLLQNKQLQDELANEEPLSFPWEVEQKRWPLFEINGGGRKLLDDFADSLKFVNKMYTQTFGPAARKVPAHMPHMIDKHVMEELQSRWPNEWNATAGHRLRSGQDMQYAFAYFYYLIHAKVDYNLTNVWRVELDMNHDGELDDNELRTLGVHIYGAPLKQPAFDELKERLVNTCLSLQTQEAGYVQPVHEDDGSSLDSSEAKAIHCPITLNVVEHDNKTAEEIKKTFSKKTKYRHQIEGTDEVAFLMIGNNDTVVQGKLDGIRTKRQKFICLNDNMNHSSSDTMAVVKVLHDLYTALVPLPSSFELPTGVRNAYLYIDEIKAAKAAAYRSRQYTVVVGVVAVVVMVVAVWRCRQYASRSDRRVRERRAKRLLLSGAFS